MDASTGLTPYQIEVARIFFELEAATGFVVAGGAALLASDLISRQTEDLDLFASGPVTSVEEAGGAFTRALAQWGHAITVVHRSPTFWRAIVRRGNDEVLVDLAIDSPPSVAPTMTLLGPTLAPLELAGRKLLALFGRAEARDFADVYLLAQRFGQDALLDQARSIDPGFDAAVLAQMMRTLARFDDSEVPLAAADIAAARDYFTDWARGLS